MEIPPKERLSDLYLSLSEGELCLIELEGKYNMENEALKTGQGYADGDCILTYEMSLSSAVTGIPVLPKPSSVLWYDCRKRENDGLYTAYIFLLEIKPEYRRKGIGSAYDKINCRAFSEFKIDRVELVAARQGIVVWPRMGYRFINERDFWNDFAEYCEYADDGHLYRGIDVFSDIPNEYFETIAESSYEYRMYKKL